MKAFRGSHPVNGFQFSQRKGISALFFASVNRGPGNPAGATTTTARSQARQKSRHAMILTTVAPAHLQFSIAMSNPLSITVTDTEDGEARGVRFDDECVLIPGPQHRSRMTKLLAKPSAFIFKRKPSHQDHHHLHSPVSSTPRDYDAPQTPTSPRSA